MTLTSPPLALSVTNAAGLPVLTIGDGLPINLLTVRVANTAGQPLSLRGGTPAPDDKPDAAAASALSLYFGALLTQPQYAAISIGAAGWTARQLGALPAWTIAPDADMTLAAGDSLTFTVTGVNVSVAPSSGHLTIDYANFGMAGSGLVRAPLDCRVPPLTRSPMTLSVSDPWIVSDGRNNSLVLQVENSTSPLASIGASWDPSAPPVFSLSFVYDAEDPFALTSATWAAEIIVAPSRWTPDPQPSGDAPVWTLRPGTPPVLGADQGTLIETITVGNIVSYLPPGLARISLRWSHLPDYADGEVIAYIKKIAPIAITGLSCDPAWTLAGVPIHPIVRWKISGSPPTSLELVGPDGRHSVDATDTSREYPTALSEATTLKLHAEGPGGPAEDHTSFDAVAFQTKLAVPLDRDLIPTPTVVCRSYRWDAVYVGCFEDLPEVRVGTVVITPETHNVRILILDGTSGSQLAATDAPWSAPQSAVGMWQSPPVVAGIDRLAVVGDSEIQMWDIGENRSATKRATIPKTSASQFLGFLDDGDLLIGGLNPDPSVDVPKTFDVVRQDPLGSRPAVSVRVLPLDGIALRFVLTLDTECLLSMVWKGEIESKDDPRNETAVAPVVVRKTRISDGVHLDEVSLGQWYFIDMWLGAGLGAFPLVPARDGSAYLLFRVAMTGTGPTPLPFGNNVPELVQFSLDGSGEARSLTIPEVASVSRTAAIAPQLSPNGNDLVIPAAGFLWIAPLSQPTAGVELKLGEPGTVEFSSGGDRLTLVVMDSNNQLAYSIVELNRTVASRSIGPSL